MAIHIKKKNKGLLHKKLGVPQDEPIPAGKLQAALHSRSAKEREEANFAEVSKGWSHSR
jgi:hypothetical protein